MLAGATRVTRRRDATTGSTARRKIETRRRIDIIYYTTDYCTITTNVRYCVIKLLFILHFHRRTLHPVH